MTYVPVLGGWAILLSVQGNFATVSAQTGLNWFLLSLQAAKPSDEKRYFCFHHQDFLTTETHGHTEVVIDLLFDEEIFKPKILMMVTWLGFFNIEEFYQSWNFDCFWWIFKNIKPTCCTYQNLCMTFANILGFLINFSTSWKSCVKGQWPKKSLFWHFWLNFMICNSKPKREWNIFRSRKSW